MNDNSYSFLKADQHILSHIEKRVVEKSPSFLCPLNMMMKENVQVAYMLNEALNQFKGKIPYNSFFCNSHLESVHGAIKLARHFIRQERKRDYDGHVLIFDAENYYQDYFSQLAEPMRNELIPGVFTITDFENFLIEVKKGGILIVICSIIEMPGDRYKSFFDVCKQHGIISILDLSRIKKMSEIGFIESVIDKFDIVTWGEIFTNFQIPFGAFSAKLEIFKVWNNSSHCSTHSSTFGGNGMVLSYVRDYIYEIFPIFKKSKKYEDLLNKIGTSIKFRQLISRNHLNAFTTIQFSVIYPHLYFDKAEGAFLKPAGSQDKYLKLDCVGGSGCNTLGHNRSDILQQIVRSHDDGKDYLKQLNIKITQATGLEKLFQGVSGASAVETGIAIALLANPDKKKILIFNGNFGGKTLISLNSTSGNHEFFKPLYEHVIEFNVNQPNVHDELKKILTSGDISLVWMEIIQGRSLKLVEKELLDLVSLYKADYKYLIGADEILNGIYRTGSFLSFSSHLLQPDIITFAKAFSGMILPVSFTAVSLKVYQNAKIKNGRLVTKLANMYVNQLTAHIAVKFLEEIEKENIKDNVQRVVDILVAGFPSIVHQSPLLSGIDAFGLHLRINLAMEKFPFNYLGHERSNAVLTYLFYAKANTFCLFGRLLPPLNIGENEVNHILRALTKVFSYHPLYFFWIGFKQNLVKSWKLFKIKFMVKLY